MRGVLRIGLSILAFAIALSPIIALIWVLAGFEVVKTAVLWAILFIVSIWAGIAVFEYAND